MSKVVFFSIAAICGIGVPATTSAYYWTQESIWDQLSEYLIPVSQNGDNWNDIWTQLRIKLNGNNEIKDESLLRVKGLTNDSKGDELKKWCFNSYEKSYWSLFQKENKNLKNEVKNACTRTIEEHLASTKIIFNDNEDTNKSLFLSKINDLKNHDDKKVKLDNFLKKLKKNYSQEDSWKELRKWCKDAYSKGYQGEKSDRWILVQLYCKNT